MSKKKKVTEDTEIKKVSNNPTKIEPPPPVEETEDLDAAAEAEESEQEPAPKKYHCPKCGAKYNEYDVKIDLGSSKHCEKCFAEGVARFCPPLAPYQTREE